MAKYKLITSGVKITCTHPKLGKITFDADTAKEEDYEFYYNNGFSSAFKVEDVTDVPSPLAEELVTIVKYKNVEHVVGTKIKRNEPLDEI